LQGSRIPQKIISRKRRAVRVSPSDVKELLVTKTPKEYAFDLQKGKLGNFVIAAERVLATQGPAKAREFFSDVSDHVRSHKPCKGAHQDTVDEIAKRLVENDRYAMIINNQTYNGSGSGETDVFAISIAGNKLFYHYYEIKNAGYGAAAKQIARWMNYMHEFGVPRERTKGIFVFYGDDIETRVAKYQRK
jgi:hypothetical protein